MNKLLKYKYSIFISVLSIFVLGCLFLLFKYSYSKYVDSAERKNNKVLSSSMYISSNLLFDSTKTINLYSYDTNNYYFKVYNYESETQVSTRDISYTLTCTTDSGYTCNIDGSGSSHTYTLNKSFTCSDSTLTEEECRSQATIVYNGVERQHAFNVRATSGNSTGTANVTITLTTSAPFSKTLSINVVANFTSDQGVEIIPIERSDSYCRYRITNYTDVYREYIFVTANNNVRFQSDYSTSYRLYLSKYQRIYVNVYKKSASLSCESAISLQS